MAYGKISTKQREILEYIKQEILNKGYPPAVREICEAVDLKSTSSVHSHLETLEKNGYIRRDPTKPRAIEIIDDNFNLTRREVVNVPILGNVAAGQPLLAVENIETYFPIPTEFLPNAETFMLRVKGESMINVGIFDGDNVLVEKQSTARNGEMVVISAFSRRMTRWIRSLFQIARFSERSLVFSVFFPDEVRYSWNKMQIPIIMYKKESCFSGFSACGGLL